MELQLLYLLLATIIGFSSLIFFLLKLRKSQFKKNLLWTSSDVWETVSRRATALGLEKTNLLYGIIQDQSFFEAALLLKNSKDEVIGVSFYPTAKRERKMKVGDQNYIIEFPLTMNSTAILRRETGQEVLASYVKKSWSGKHEFDVPGHGRFISNRPSLNLKACFDYIHNGKVIGTIQNISFTQKLGRLAILPPSLPLEVRLFMLSV